MRSLLAVPLILTGAAGCAVPVVMAVGLAGPREHDAWANASKADPTIIHVECVGALHYCVSKAHTYCQHGFTHAIGQDPAWKPRSEAENWMSVRCNPAAEVAAGPPTSACRLALADAPLYAKRWATTHPDDRMRDGVPSDDEFASTCQALPDEAQRCLVLNYAEARSDACTVTFDGLPPKYRVRVALLFSTP